MPSFLLLLAIAICVYYIGKRLAPPIVPRSRFKCIAVSLGGGLAISFAFYLNHVLSGADVGWANPVGGLIGSIIALLIFGIVPFVKIFLGRV
jgi:hypothetical protein